ncbi:DUF2892 domain-containing protein [Thalassotalea ponticola]|uniref:YgaP family membrane protein n=1 Tax=Thalassotalea ponticola TaxID=1523392 RepID=UPI0025B2B761|nr:DUF2892 domain-containing protein [Thalassotalea ponticola]MDN3653667.1 DUF2892 domain-containing protein [Thalassotalea ponticola]
MGSNVGIVDRVMRIVVGLVMICWAATYGPSWGYIGIVPLLTGIFKFCPVYRVLGMNTCGRH